MSGTSLTTKGLISGGGSSVEPAEPGAGPLPPPLTFLPQSASGPVLIVIPTPTNVVLLAAENITANLRAQQPASMTLPSLYKRAFLVANETDEIAVVKP